MPMNKLPLIFCFYNKRVEIFFLPIKTVMYKRKETAKSCIARNCDEKCSVNLELNKT